MSRKLIHEMSGVEILIAQREDAREDLMFARKNLKAAEKRSDPEAVAIMRANVEIAESELERLS